jgi:hypothetical protein
MFVLFRYTGIVPDAVEITTMYVKMKDSYNLGYNKYHLSERL